MLTEVNLDTIPMPEVANHSYSSNQVSSYMMLPYTSNLITKSYSICEKLLASRFPALIPESRWDYIVVFPNPDDPDLPLRSISAFEAEKIYRACFLHRSCKTYQEMKDIKIEVTGFMLAFNTLLETGDFKRYSQGKSLISEDRQLIRPHDFLTLIRNTFIAKLTNELNLTATQIFSSNGKHVYVCISANEQALEFEAERIYHSKQLEVGVIDLFSVEPCDLNLRPFRLLELPPEIKSLELSELYIDAFCGDQDTEEVIIMYEPFGVTEDQLKAYKRYLQRLKELYTPLCGKSLFERMRFYKKIMLKALDFANKEGKVLLNLWDRLKIDKPVGPYCNFRQSIEKSCWKTYKVESTTSLFSKMERIKLLHSYIHNWIALYELQHMELITHHFPAHDMDEIFELKRAWNISLLNMDIPIDKIKNYFGEKIGFYFEFLKTYQNSLLLPSSVGTLVFGLQIVIGDPYLLITNALFSLFMTVWATVFMESWIRRQSSLASLWGVNDYEEREVNRPNFKGKTRRSPVSDDMEEVYYETTSRVRFFLITFLVTLAMISLVFGMVIGIIILRWQITDSLIVGGIDMAGFICATLNAFQILIFNMFYEWIVLKLNNLENYRTQSQYESALIIKTYIFQFFNSFNSLFYIAFVKSDWEGCILWEENVKVRKIGASCMDELMVQLYALFVVSYLKNIFELGRPWLRKVLNRRKIGTRTIAIETQMCSEQYLTNEVDGTVEDYLELAVLFGFITLFAVACPISSVLLCIGLWMEMHVDKYKILHLHRRPLPLGAKNIGMWWTIFSFNSVLSIFTNTAVLCFTSNAFEDWKESDVHFVYAFVVFGLLGARWLFRVLIPDIPKKFQVMLKRHKHIIERSIRGFNVVNGDN